MRVLSNKLLKNIEIPPYLNNFPHCLREYCYCVKTTKLNDKRNQRAYLECYHMWYKFYTM